MKTNIIAPIALFAFVLGFVLGVVTYRKVKPCITLPVVEVHTDTVTVRDTLRFDRPVPVNTVVVRRDTVKIQIRPADSVAGLGDTLILSTPRSVDTAIRTQPDGNISIPITKKEYKTPDYRAVIEGWRPALLSMEVYPKTMTVTRTETRLKSPRWAVTLGPGVGYYNKAVKPVLSLTAGFVIWSR